MAVWHRNKQAQQFQEPKYDLFENKEGFQKVMDNLKALMTCAITEDSPEFEQALQAYNTGTQFFYYKLTREEILEIRKSHQKLNFFKRSLAIRFNNQLSKNEPWDIETNYYVIGQAFKDAHFY